MPPAVRKPSLPDALTAFAAQRDAVLSATAGLSESELTVASAVPGWSRRDVVAHLVTALEALRDATASRAAPLPLADFVEGYAAAAEEIAGQPGDLVGDPRGRLAAACAGVVDRTGWPPTVVMWDDPLTAADAVSTRVLELVVHGLDLGVEPARPALALAVRLLSGVLATRRPGRAVELRVAPFAAVQVLEGTVHRRGTPTAVVSAEPTAFVLLATGRLSWDDAVASGSVTASGERSDLSPYLPVLS